MTDFASCESPSGFTLPEIDVVLQHSSAVSLGDVYIVQPDILLVTGNVVTGGLVATSAAKKAGMVVVALGNYAANKPGRYRMQGICRAYMKSLSGSAIVRGMAMALTTVNDLDVDGPASINVGRWTAKAITEFAAGATGSTTPALGLVELAGPPGLGNFASGT